MSECFVLFFWFLKFLVNVLDKGFLSIEEFKGIIKEIEPELPEKELDDVVDEVDADGSGRIEFEEFLAVMVGGDD